jgi:hypothetical protein
LEKKFLIANEERFKILSEAFGASKEIKIGRFRKVYINQFSKPSKKIALNSALWVS